MQKRNAHVESALPVELLQPTPRQLRPSAMGAVVLFIAATLAVGSVTTGFVFYFGPEHGWRTYVIPTAMIVVASVLIRLFIIEVRLLTEGRPALAVVTKVIARHSSHGGSYWRVYFEWMLLSGARASGHYRYRKKTPPAPGVTIAIIYDRDDARRYAKYPLSLVSLRGRR